jgi:hypothetical protein
LSVRDHLDQPDQAERPQVGPIGSLPSGASETGTWSAEAPLVTGVQEFPVAISFPFPVTGGGEEAFFFTEEEVREQEFTHGCKWKQEDVTPKPESTTPGTLCVFEQYGDGKISFSFFQTPGEVFGSGYSPSGAYLIFSKASTATAISRQIVGTWAVTAE